MVGLDRKYRPKGITQLWGNQLVKDMVVSWANSNSIPNTILISGEVGTGKSSLAYILSKLITCKSRHGYTPCETCTNCQQINEMYNTGEIVGVDVQRLSLSNFEDADVKSYLDNIIKSITTKKKRPRVYFIDELQQIPLLEQERLNDVTEYIDENSYVIITTSNLSRIAKSLITRFTHIEIKPPTLDEQISNLTSICQAENIELNGSQLKVLIEKSNSNPRLVMRNLTNIQKSGIQYFYTLTKDVNENIKICIEYFNAIKMGIFGIIPYLEEHEDINKVYYNLPDFIYKLFSVKYSKTPIEKELLITLREINHLYKEKTLIDILDNLDTKYSYNRDEIKTKLLCIGSKLNESIYEQIDFEDATASVIAKGNETSLYSDNTGEPDNDLTNYSTNTTNNNTGSSIKEFSTLSLGSGKDTGVTVSDL